MLRKIVGNTRNLAWGKLGPNWEGLYHLTSVAGVGAYYLKDLDERTVLHPWNVNNLKRITIDKKCYTMFFAFIHLNCVLRMI